MSYDEHLISMAGGDGEPSDSPAPMECAYCGRRIREDAPKVWLHVDDDCVYCEPGDAANKGLALPVRTNRS